MSEHRSATAKIVSLSFPADDEVAFPSDHWPEEIIAQWVTEAQLHHDVIETGALSIEMLMDIQRECFSMLTLYREGLPPCRQEEFMAALAPRWAEYKALTERNRKAAKAMLARRAGNGQ